MNARSTCKIVLTTLCCLCVIDASADKIKKRDTIADLEDKTVEVRPGTVIIDSGYKARDNYREFLDLMSNDPDLRAEAMRRLGDLELEAI